MVIYLVFAAVCLLTLFALLHQSSNTLQEGRQ
jgi:hypothetical protein